MWSIYFKDYYGRVTTVEQNIAPSGTATLYMIITAGDEDSAPEDSEVTVTVTGSVCNDTRYGGTKAVGGEDLTASDSFTADEEDAEEWWEGWPYSEWWFSYLVAGIILICVVICLFLYSRPKGRRRQR